MPILRRRERGRRNLTWHDLDISDLMTVSFGYLDDGGRRAGTHFKNLDSLKEFYLDHRDEIESLATDRNDPNWHRRRHPGKYTFCSWKFWLLLEEPRLRVTEDPDYEDRSDRMPRGHCWESSDGYESSFRYLHRRELLELGEIEAIRRFEERQTGLWVKGSREPARPYSRGMLPVELADIATIWGHDILTADELEIAEPYLLD